MTLKENLLSYHYFVLKIFSLIIARKINVILITFTISFFSLNLSCKNDDDNYLVTPLAAKVTKKKQQKKRTRVGRLYSFSPWWFREACRLKCSIILLFRYQVMMDCWHSNPGLRPTFDQLVERLEKMSVSS